MPLPQTPPTWTAVTTGSNEYSIELNDANLETKAWKSSRYDGSRTVTQQLNRYSVGDTTFGKTAAVQKYSRNIYIGNAIVGMDNGGEDSLLFNFPAFSYATTIRYITINDDDSISDNKLESKKTDFDAKRGFYRAFYEDFPIGSDCRIIVNDESTKINLKDRYNVYFNGGQLQHMFQLSIRDKWGILTYTSSSNRLIYNITDFENGTLKGPQVTGLSSTIFNELLINEFYSGSLQTSIPVGPLKGGGVSVVISEDVNSSRLEELWDAAFEYKSNSEYKGDKRFFASFTYSGSVEPIRTTISGSYPQGDPATSYKTERLSELSTGELTSHNSNNNRLIFSPETRLNQHYVSNIHTNYIDGEIASNGLDATTETGKTPLTFNSGSVIFSKLEDATPSLLLPLPKNEHLPDGVGGKSFVIIPENLHPHIKRNLTHYLAKAGISLGVDTIPAIDNTFKKLK